MSDNDIVFYDSHEPALEDGNYTVAVSHTVQAKDNSTSSPTAVNQTYSSQTLEFYVSGPRFNLDPSLIHSVYPPAGGKGDYLADLPSLVLNRSTLPWERSPVNLEITSNSASWLFLLLVDEMEQDSVTEHNSANLTEISAYLISESTGTTPLTSDDMSRLPARINYLEVAPSLSSAILPGTLKELQYLSYARIQGANADVPQDSPEEKAVLLCNRLPHRGRNSAVYLISVENNYTGSDGSATFSGIKNASGNHIFPYMYKWQFHAFDEQLYCVTETIAANIKETLSKQTPPVGPIDFSKIYDQLMDNTEAFMTTLNDFKITDPTTIKIIARAARLPGSTFHGLLSNLAGGFAPFTINASAGNITATGTVNLPYHKISRATGMTQVYASAWYRGPLASGEIDVSGTGLDFMTPPKSPNELILKDPSGNYDLSYAAAFELGRLTALNDVDFATEFYKWKSETAMAKRLEALGSKTGYKNILHLPLADAPQVKDIPQHVIDKFTSWKKFQGIPYRYLVSDADLLPNESIRFFRVDNNWINAFVCGAFAIGHTVEADLSGYLHCLFANTEGTGFLINSLAVSGWPDFEVDAVSAEGSDLSLLRKDNLDVNIRLYLWSGRFSELKFHLHPGKLHSGFLYENNKFTKVDGTIDLTNCISNNVISVASILHYLWGGTQPPVAQFAAKMMEGTPTVVFTIK